MIDRRVLDTATMWRTRLLIGALSVAHGVTGLWLPHTSALGVLIERDAYGWLFPISLIAVGSLMIFAAIAEKMGTTRRWCREFSASLLVVVWSAVWVHSLDGSPDYYILVAPILCAAAAWSWVVEATAERNKKITRKKACQ